MIYGQSGHLHSLKHSPDYNALPIWEAVPILILSRVTAHLNAECRRQCTIRRLVWQGLMQRLHITIGRSLLFFCSRKFVEFTRFEMFQHIKEIHFHALPLQSYDHVVTCGIPNNDWAAPSMKMDQYLPGWKIALSYHSWYSCCAPIFIATSEIFLFFKLMVSFCWYSASFAVASNSIHSWHQANRLDFRIFIF